MKLKELCLEITNQCHLNCVYCSSFNYSDRLSCSQHISLPTMERIISEFVDLGGETLELSGGEPLTYPNIVDIVKYAADKKKLDVVLYTSGVLPNHDVGKLIHILVKNGLRKIVFNCQGIQSVHDNLVRKNGAFDVLVDSIRHAKNTGAWIGIHFVPNKLNIANFEDVFYFAQEHKIDEIAILRLVRQGRAVSHWEDIKVTDSDLAILFDQVSRLVDQKSNVSIRIGYPFFPLIASTYPNLLKLVNSSKCHCGKSSLCIMSNGNVIPCPAFKDISKAVVGNCFQHRLVHIWHQSLFLNQLRSLNDIEYCNQCSFFNTCRGGCTAQRYIANRSISVGPDPICRGL